MTPAVQLSGAAKRYWQLSEPPMLLKSLVPFTRPKRTERWALQGMDLRIERGETVGVVGRNGAGKTTLLRLLAGVSRPSAGEVQVFGRVAPLISVGVGFHQEMSGRENVFVNGLLLGLSRSELEERFEAIVDFAELDEFIDTPVKFYSTGMFMRLGFSVAVHSAPDVLLVDEVLAVGDLAFQVKCLERMRELQREGTTIVLVSHSMPAIRMLCPRSLLIHHGQLDFDGPTEEAIARHHELLTLEHAAADGGAVSIVERSVLGPNGPTHHPGFDDVLTYRCRLRFNRPVDTPQVHFQVVSEDGTVAYSLTSDLTRAGRGYEAGEEADVEVAFRSRLGAGTFRLETLITDRALRELLAQDAPGVMIFCAGRPGRGGIADLAAEMTIDGTVVTDIPDQTLHRVVDGPGGR